MFLGVLASHDVIESLTAHLHTHDMHGALTERRDGEAMEAEKGGSSTSDRG